YGYIHEGRPLEIVAARVRAAHPSPTTLPQSQRLDSHQPTADGSHSLYFEGGLRSASLFHRDRLTPGACITGPAIIVEPLTTTIPDPGWEATPPSGGELLLTAAATSGATASTRQSVIRNPQSAPDPVLLEVFNNHFTAIATQMGITLRNTSMSVNVKERLDF